MFRFDSRRQKAQELELSELRAKSAAMVRSQAVIEFELDGTIITANQNFLGAMGYTADEVIGRKHSMFVPADFAKSAEYAAFWDALRRGEFMAEKYLRIGKGGREVWIQASYNPVINADGSVVKVIKIATDITAEEQAAHAAEKARRQAEAQRQLVVSVLGLSLIHI